VTEIRFQNHSDVELVQFTGSDEMVVQSARVSLTGGKSEQLKEATKTGMIRHMMDNRHGSVFEHNLFTFRVHTPIFVAREFMRHRMFSYNELSGRYATAEPVFYVPDPFRKLRQQGKASAYDLVDGPRPQKDFEFVRDELKAGSSAAFEQYEAMLEASIAREVARMVLPVNLFTSFYATCNARSMMSFLSLRVDSEQNSVETHPLAEIQEVACLMEDWFEEKMPETHRAFYRNGRVAP